MTEFFIFLFLFQLSAVHRKNVDLQEGLRVIYSSFGATHGGRLIIAPTIIYKRFCSLLRSPEYTTTLR